MERLQEISTGIIIAIALFGAFGWLYEKYQEPDLTNGQYFESAWLDIKDAQLTLFVEFVPDGKGRGINAVLEAVRRVKEKAWINSRIDGRPVVVVMMVRDHTILVPMAAIVIYDNMDIYGKKYNTTEIFQKSANRMSFIYNGTQIEIINESDGSTILVNTTEYKSKFESGDLLFASCILVPAIFKYQDLLG